MSATDHPGVTFRPALDADLPACYAVFHASQVELHQRRNLPWTVRPFDPAGPWATVQRHLIAHAAIDRPAYGFERSIDHELWSRMSSRSTLWLDDGEPCAYSYRGSFAGVIGPVAGVDAPSAARALRAELADTPAGDRVRVNVPGTATALVQVALEAGLRFDDPELLLLSS
jgi:hypothetical protein